MLLGILDQVPGQFNQMCWRHWTTRTCTDVYYLIDASQMCAQVKMGLGHGSKNKQLDRPRIG